MWAPFFPIIGISFLYVLPEHCQRSLWQIKLFFSACRKKTSRNAVFMPCIGAICHNMRLFDVKIPLISVVVFQVEWLSEPGRDVAAYRPSHNTRESKLKILHAEKLLYSRNPPRPRCLGQEPHPRGPCPQKRASLRPTLGVSSGKRRRPLQPAVGRTRVGPRTLEAALPLPLGSFSSCRPSIRTPPLSWHRPRTSMDQIK